MKVYFQLDDGGIQEFDSDHRSYMKPYNQRQLGDLIHEIAEHLHRTDFEAFREGKESVIELFADYDEEKDTGTVIARAKIRLSYKPVVSVNLDD